MASITRFGFFAHLRAETNQFILHHSNGKLTRRGPGISYIFNPLVSAIAQLPREDWETTFLMRERSSDMQEVAVQCTLTYRFADHEVAASRFNFSISLDRGQWLDPPHERLASFWSQRAQKPARDYLVGVPVVEALKNGPSAIRAAIEQAFAGDAEIKAMGLELISVQVTNVAPESDVEKALQTPTREAIQQKADEATFARRAMAVEKERAIKENELATEIELAARQEDLLRRQGANALLAANQASEVAMAQVLASIEQEKLSADGKAEQARIRAAGEADSVRTLAAARAEAEARRVEIYSGAPSQVIMGLALQQFAQKIETINHLNITPDMLGSMFQQFLHNQDQV